MAAELRFEDDQDECCKKKHDRGVSNREEIQSEEAEKYEQGAEGTGYDSTGDVELQIDEEATEDEKENGDVGVGELAEETLAQGGGNGNNLGSLEM